MNRNEWVTLDKAANELAQMLGEEVDEARILYLALNHHLTLSVFFQDSVLGMRRRYSSTPVGPNCTSATSEEVGDGEYLITYTRPSVVSHDVWDLPLTGTDRNLLELRYQELKGHTLLPLRSVTAAHLPQVCRLNTQGFMEYFILIEPARPDAPEGVEYQPAESFPDDAVIVARQDALAECARRLLRCKDMAGDCNRPDYGKYSRRSSWMLYEAMLLLLGQRPYISCGGGALRFAVVVQQVAHRGDDDSYMAACTEEAAYLERFRDEWRDLCQDVVDDLATGDLPVLDDSKPSPGTWQLNHVPLSRFLEVVVGVGGEKAWTSGPVIANPEDHPAFLRCRPADFLRWAESRGYDIPEELRPLLEEGETGALTTKQRNEELQKEANNLAMEWKEDGRKVTKREIAKELANKEKWQKLKLTDTRIERIIAKEW
ncbi:MAG TPA: hypothetical protein ENJ12_13480 [Thiolapillus brandeum]|uniref:Uncharacterized protein n=1 Tax=Thiolapillus brandeum TaxID=1076588 RepID=A0A831WBT6_9GAMM|nr:hypothetical protein [Thiolapillus brandeum]